MKVRETSNQNVVDPQQWISDMLKRAAKSVEKKESFSFLFAVGEKEAVRASFADSHSSLEIRPIFDAEAQLSYSIIDLREGVDMYSAFAHAISMLREEISDSDSEESPCNLNLHYENGRIRGSLQGAKRTLRIEGKEKI